jgi:hypothetical protein
MQKFVGWSFMHQKTNKCGKCGMKEKKRGCCKDEHKQIKVKIDHHSANKVQVSKNIECEKIATSSFEYQPTLQSKSQVIQFANSPPPPGSRLNLLYCVFLI